MKYFNNCKNLEELKKEYRRLAFENHPDRGGDEATMKAINDEYQRRAEEIKAGEPMGSKAKAETPEAFVTIIDKLMRMSGIEIEICGSWVWVSGNTYMNREGLAAAGFKYSKNKRSWYWYEGCEDNAKRRGHYSMDEIRMKYGSTSIHSKGLDAITA